MNRPDTATVFRTYLPGAVTVTAAVPLRLWAGRYGGRPAGPAYLDADA
jgi:hypothetical protein